MTQQVNKSNSEITSYTYDAENQLTQINQPNGSIAQYRYDALGRRIEKDINGTITRYVYDSEDILLEFDGTNNKAVRYTHGLGIEEPLVMERDNQNLFYHVDGLGSIIDITDSNGTIVQSYLYDSFGNITQQTGTLINPYTYTGREFDFKNGLYYYRTRYYDSVMGRFLNEDPIGFVAGDNNFYKYVKNSPIGFVDPFGLKNIVTSKYGNTPFAIAADAVIGAAKITLGNAEAAFGVMLAIGTVVEDFCPIAGGALNDIPSFIAASAAVAHGNVTTQNAITDLINLANGNQGNNQAPSVLKSNNR